MVWLCLVILSDRGRVLEEPLSKCPLFRYLRALDIQDLESRDGSPSSGGLPALHELERPVDLPPMAGSCPKGFGKTLYST